MQADDPHALSVDEPTLALHYAAAAQGISVAGERAGKPTLRLVVGRTCVARRAALRQLDDEWKKRRKGRTHAAPPSHWVLATDSPAYRSCCLRRDSSFVVD